MTLIPPLAEDLPGPHKPRPPWSRKAGACPGVIRRWRRYEARFAHRGRLVYLGLFEFEADAVRIRRQAEKLKDSGALVDCKTPADVRRVVNASLAD
jgi:hypothetical protein